MPVSLLNYKCKRTHVVSQIFVVVHASYGWVVYSLPALHCERCGKELSSISKCVFDRLEGCCLLHTRSLSTIEEELCTVFEVHLPNCSVI